MSSYVLTSAFQRLTSLWKTDCEWRYLYARNSWVIIDFRWDRLRVALFLPIYSSNVQSMRNRSICGRLFLFWVSGIVRQGRLDFLMPFPDTVAADRKRNSHLLILFYNSIEVLRQTYWQYTANSEPVQSTGTVHCLRLFTKVLPRSVRLTGENRM